MALSREAQERSQIFNALNASQVRGRIWQVQDTGQILQAEWIEVRLFRLIKLDKAEEAEGIGQNGSCLKGEQSVFRGLCL